MSYRAARLAVVVLSALIILALIGLVVGFITKFAAKSHAAGASAVPGSTILLPAGAKILKAETQPGRLIVQLQTDGGDEIDIYNLEDGALITRIEAAP